MHESAIAASAGCARDDVLAPCPRAPRDSALSGEEWTGAETFG
jgi:hypothetical protein